MKKFFAAKLKWTVAFLLVGMLVDFVFVGVLKIIWIAIYGTTYLALAMTMETKLANSKHKDMAKSSVLAFLCGAILSHLTFVGHTVHETFMLSKISENPVVLRSPDFPEILYVTSEALSHALKEEGRDTGIPMDTESIMDYGCVRKFAIASVDHVDLQGDPAANWTLRFDHVGVFTTMDAPTKPKSTWPWCKLIFYRPTSS